MLPSRQQNAQEIFSRRRAARRIETQGGTKLFAARLLLLLLVAALTPPLRAEWHPIGDATAARRVPGGAEFLAGTSRVRVLAVGESAIRIRLAPHGVFVPDSSWAVLQEEARVGRAELREVRGGWEIRTGAITVRVRKRPLYLAFVDAAGNILGEDDSRRPMAWDGTAVRAWKIMPPEEYYYGLGDKAGSFDHRGHAYTNWNTDAFFWQEASDPLYKSIPFFLAVRPGVSYGIFFDNTYRSHFDFGESAADTYSFGADGGELNYYFFYGPTPQQVLEKFTALTGRMPLPPLWALGYQQSRYSYYPESRVRELARTFREKNIPADVIYLDIDYMDGYRSFTVNRTFFPHFEDMLAELARLGFRVVAIVDPGIKREPGYAVYDQGLANNVFVRNPDGSLFEGRVWPGLCVFPDFASEKTRKWWGSLYAGLIRAGVSGIWNDMNEPSLFGRQDRTMARDAVHQADDRTLDHREFHNAYGMEMVRATYEGLERLRPNERPFVLTRAAYAGTERYAATWTGDNTSSWEHLRLTVRTLLNLGLSGYSFVGADVGGFIGSPPPDLLTRWIELGSFLPLDRNHTAKGTADQEPWVNGPEHEAIRRRYIELRYRLLPYIYTRFEESSRTGLPVMRPLALSFPGDEALAENDTEFLFGPDLLVAPKLFEMSDPYPVQLPPGGWYDYWTGERIPGGQTIEVAPPLDVLPLYARAGAILPEQPAVQNTQEIPDGPLQLRVYPGPECHSSLYQDDGTTYAYTRGGYMRVSYSCAITQNGFTLTASPRQGRFEPWWKDIRVEVLGMKNPPRNVLLDGRTVTGWGFDRNTGNVSVTIPDHASGWKLVLQSAEP